MNYWTAAAATTTPPLRCGSRLPGIRRRPPPPRLTMFLREQCVVPWRSLLRDDAVRMGQPSAQCRVRVGRMYAKPTTRSSRVCHTHGRVRNKTISLISATRTRIQRHGRRSEKRRSRVDGKSERFGERTVPYSVGGCPVGGELPSCPLRSIATKIRKTVVLSSKYSPLLGGELQSLGCGLFLPRGAALEPCNNIRNRRQ